MKEMSDVLFNAPIPGESLTVEFGTRPWHRPPEIPDPVDALDWHLDRLEEPEIKEAALGALELGIPVRDLNLGMLRAAVAQAKHDMDTMFIIAATTHEALELMAEEAGIEYKTGFEPTEEDREAEYQINVLKAKKLLEKHAKTGDLKGVTAEDLGADEMPVEGESELEVPEMVEEAPEAPVRKPTGLMARGK